MPVIKIGAKSLGAIKPSGKTEFYYDADLKGFGLVVRPTGARSFFVEYRLGAGGRAARKKRVVLGSASTLTAEQARQAAKDTLAAARLGKDAAAERSEARGGITVADLAARFLKEHVEAKRKSRTAIDYGSIIKAMVVPAIGRHQARSVTSAEIAKLHLRHAEKPTRANRMLAVLSSMLSFGGKHGLVDKGFNPARGIEGFPETRRERYLSADEFARLGKALHEAETIGIPWEKQDRQKHGTSAEKRRTILSPHGTGAIRLLLFTGCRLREILHLRWTDVDAERGFLLLPDSKTGRKVVILNAAAQSVLTALPRLGEFVIAGNDPEKPRSDLSKPWRLVSRHAGISGVRIHDLRHTFASVGAGGGLGLPIIGKLLGHTQAATTARYAHLDADPLRRATNAIGDAILAAMTAEVPNER